MMQPFGLRQDDSEFEKKIIERGKSLRNFIDRLNADEKEAQILKYESDLDTANRNLKVFQDLGDSSEDNK